MSSFKSISKKIHKLCPDITVKEDRGCIVLTGEVAEWKTAVKAGKLAVDKRYLGVVNRVTEKGFVQKAFALPVRDKKYDGLSPDVLIVGGGIVGCAAARELSKYNIDVMLVERGSDVAVGGSSRNGGVVHVGINYSPDSEKHIYNHAGNKMYRALTDELDVPFEQKGQVLLIGKRWEKILCDVLTLNSKSLKIEGVKFMKAAELKSVEPYIPDWCYGGLFMPIGGITSPYKMTVALAECAAKNGVKICLDTAVEGMTVENGKIISVDTNRGLLRPKLVINAAGVYSDVIADMAGDRTFTIHPRKGTDIILDKKKGYLVNTSFAKSPITVPPALDGEKKVGVKDIIAALGSHTKGIGSIHSVDGNMLVGPNALETPDREDTTTDSESMFAIFDAQKRVSEKIERSDVIAYFSGVRAPTYEEDFQVRKGVYTENILEAAGIQSPGVTAAPAIAVDLAKWTVEYLTKFGEVKKNASFDPIRKAPPHLKDMPLEERDEFIKNNPDYGEIICRCEEVSKGEILDALRSPVPVFTLDGIKRRVRPGMGRCQGGFCSPLVLKIIAEEEGCKPEDVVKGAPDSNVLFSNTKNSVN